MYSFLIDEMFNSPCIPPIRNSKLGLTDYITDQSGFHDRGVIQSLPDLKIVKILRNTDHSSIDYSAERTVLFHQLLPQNGISTHFFPEKLLFVTKKLYVYLFPALPHPRSDKKRYTDRARYTPEALQLGLYFYSSAKITHAIESTDRIRSIAVPYPHSLSLFQVLF